MRGLTIALPAAIVAGAVALSSLFIVDERESALVLQFGQVRAVHTEPGLYFRIPFIQDVVRYDARILALQSQPLEVNPLDDRRLVVDAFARWRIANLEQFRQAVGAGGVRGAQARLERIMDAAIREVLGSVPSGAVLSEDRTSLLNCIRDIARREALSLGVDVIDVRLTRTDLPEQTLAATYARMRSEREREAADEIARGNEAAQRVRAMADRTVVELVSTARRDSSIIRGEADAERNRIYAEAYGRDPEFFAFTRSMTAYQQALLGGNSNMVLSPDSEFFQFFSGDGFEPGVTQVPEAPSEPISLEFAPVVTQPVTVPQVEMPQLNLDAENVSESEAAPTPPETSSGETLSAPAEAPSAN